MDLLGILNQLVRFLSAQDWAFIMGFFASIATIGGFWIQRKHNKLSVRPIAEILVGNYEDRLVAIVENKGTGPLIVTKFRVRDEEGNEKKSGIEFFESGFPNVVWKMFIHDFEGLAILPGDRKVLLEILEVQQEKTWSSTRKKVRKTLGGLEATLHYEDIYKQKMPVKSRKFDYFRRGE